MYTPKNRMSKYVRQKLIELQGEIDEIDEFTNIGGDFNTTLSEIERFSRQQISKDIDELKSISNQLDIIDIRENFIQQKQNTHPSQAHMQLSTG